MKVYFCHPVSDYRPDFETKCIEEIRIKFGDVEIINPHTDIKVSDEDKRKLSGHLDGYIEMMEKYYFPAIDRSNIVAVFASDYQNYTDGVLREISYAKYIGKSVKEWWQKDRVNFYKESGVLDFIVDYFDVKRGVRCVAGHEKDMYRLNRQPTYRLWNNNSRCRAITLPDPLTGKFDALKDYWCNHSFMYTFDESVLQWHDGAYSIPMFKNHRVGLNAIIDLDSPEENGSDKAKRLTFFDHIKEFDSTIEKIDKLMEEYTTEYNLQFSGNGIYVCLEGYYGDDLLEEYCFTNNFVNLLDQLKENHDLGNKMKVHVDNASAPWNDFFKIPFTFHESRPRISIPLPKGELDKEWIDRVSNVNNIMSDYSIIDEIIKKAGWKKIW